MQETLTHQKIFNLNYPTLNVRVFQREMLLATVDAGNATPILSVDFDGNGTIDAELPANDGGMISDPLTYISLMKQTINLFTVDKITKKQLTTDIEQIERTVERFIKYDEKEKKIFEKLAPKIRNEKILKKWKDWSEKKDKIQKRIETKILLQLIENTEKDVNRFLKQKKITGEQSDLLFTMLDELKRLIAN